MAQAQYKNVSAIARKRREAVLTSFYRDVPKLPPESELPRDLTEYAEKNDYLSQAELEIVHSEAADILKHVQERNWSATSVAKAFCKSAALAQQLVGADPYRSLSDLC